MRPTPFICGPGTRGLIRSFRRRPTCGATAPNWETGHWLTGRLGGAPLDALIAASILDDAGISDSDSSALTEIVDGYVVDRPMPPRAAIEPLALAYAFDAGEADGKLFFRQRGGEVRAELSEDDLLLPADRAPARLVRAQETELSREVSLSFTDGSADYRRSAVTSRRLTGGAARVSHADLAVVTNDASAERRANIWLQDLWAGRESAEFALPPSNLALAVGDVVGLTVRGRRHVLELRAIVDTDGRARARAVDRSGRVRRRRSRCRGGGRPSRRRPLARRMCWCSICRC